MSFFITKHRIVPCESCLACTIIKMSRLRKWKIGIQKYLAKMKQYWRRENKADKTFVFLWDIMTYVIACAEYADWFASWTRPAMGSHPLDGILNIWCSYQWIPMFNNSLYYIWRWYAMEIPQICSRIIITWQWKTCFWVTARNIDHTDFATNFALNRCAQPWTRVCWASNIVNQSFTVKVSLS